MPLHKFVLGALNSFNNVVGTPAFSFGVGIAEAERKQEELDADIARREEIAERIGPGGLFPALGALQEETEAVSAQNLAESEAFFGSAAMRFAGVADPLIADIRERESRVLAEAEGLGDVERGEVNRRFGALGRTEQARLAGLGLGGTTLAAGVSSGVERLRGRELGIVNERLQRERVDRLERLSGETIQAVGDLGFAGLDFEERSFGNLISERERLRLAGPRQAVAGAERIVEFETQDIFRQPPLPGRQNELLGLAGTTG